MDFLSATQKIQILRQKIEELKTKEENIQQERLEVQEHLEALETFHQDQIGYEQDEIGIEIQHYRFVSDQLQNRIFELESQRGELQNTLQGIIDFEEIEMSLEFRMVDLKASR